MNSKCGDIVHVREFVNVLTRKNFRVLLQIKGRANSTNLTTISLPDLRFPLSALVYILVTFTTLMCLLIKKPDYLYQRDSGINIGILLAKFLHFPVLLEINGDFSFEAKASSRVLRSIQRTFMNLTYSMADIIVIPSKGQIHNLKSHKANLEKVLVVPNGVNPKNFRPLDKIKCKNQLGLSESFYHICFVGNLAPWQGLDIALLAFSNFLESSSVPIRFLIVGDGQMTEKLEEQVASLSMKDSVVFFGSVSHDLIPYIINACDFCIAPFTSWRNKESGVSPIKLFEYLSCGKPVITTAVPGSTKLIEELNAGIVVEPDNVEALQDAYRRALKNLPYWREKEGMWHVEMARNHSWENRVDQILERIRLTNSFDF